MDTPRDKGARIRFGRLSIPVPGSKRQRVILGAGLVAVGCFVPIAGFGIMALGLLVLSVDNPAIRRRRRRLQVRWGRRRKTPKESQVGEVCR
jgi:hypothetical protein